MSKDASILDPAPEIPAPQAEDPPAQERRSRRRRVADLYGSMSCREDVELLDLSPEGVGIETTNWLAVGRRYHLEVRHGGEAMDLEGIVRWCFLDRTAPTLRHDLQPIYRAGLRVTGPGRERLRELLETLPP